MILNVHLTIQSILSSKSKVNPEAICFHNSIYVSYISKTQGTDTADFGVGVNQMWRLAQKGFFKRRPTNELKYNYLYVKHYTQLTKPVGFNHRAESEQTTRY